jgi:hypothetical protein
MLGSRLLSAQEYNAMLETQATTAVAVANDASKARVYWMFQNEFYWEDEGYSAQEVTALVLDRKRKKTRQVERAIAAMNGDTVQRARRERISDAVQREVWNRDGGRCVKCGGQARLEFDHIIPVSQGGANTVRNLQLLCETCNRSKGASIG